MSKKILLVALLLISALVAAVLVWSAPRLDKGNQNSSPSRADVARQPTDTLDFLFANSVMIVHGLVTDTRDITDDINDKQMPFHVATIKPYRTLKGTEGEPFLEVRDLGHRNSSDAGVFSDQVTFTKGEEVIVFLEWLGPEANAYLSPLGLNQGKYTIVAQGNLGSIALNGTEFADWQLNGTLPAEDSDGTPLRTDAFLRELEGRL